MRTFLIICLLSITVLAFGQGRPQQSFENLKKVKLSRAGVEFWYNPANTVVLDMAVKDVDTTLRKEIRDCVDDEYMVAHGYVMAKTRIASGDECYVIYLNSWDGGFCFYRPGTGKELGMLPSHGLLVVPGNGTIYTSGHVYNFVVRRKYEVKGDSILEVKQPYLYVGLKSKTLREVKIYDSKEKSNLVATLPPDHEIEVLIADSDYSDEEKSFYLVRTNFGLCGWAELTVGQQVSVDVKGLEYRGN